MTEAEWLSCSEHWILFGFIRNKASERKMRLFKAACARRLPPEFIDVLKRMGGFPWLEDVDLSEKPTQSTTQLIRDIFGNPFRPAQIDNSWLTWNNKTIPRIAQLIYDERKFEDLPILADALTDAGCNDEQILEHCRQKGGHVRGCWVVDLLLGKE